MTAVFHPLKIQDNLNGWGPCDAPEQLKDLPYAPFSKSDRLGKVSDWSGVTYPDKRFGFKFTPQWGTGLYSYPLDDDESNFHLVDTTKVQKPIYQKGRVRYNQTKLKKEREKRQQAQASMQVLSKTQKSRERDRQRQLRKWQKQFGKQQMEQMKKTPLKHRTASVQVKDSWSVLEEMDFPRLSKLSLPKVPQAQDLLKCGSLEYYEKSYDRISTRHDKKLTRVHRIFHRISTTDDPNIRQLSKKTGNVFATDSILAVLMCACRSVYSWDIVVSKVGKVLFFDKRDESDFDLPTVSETATEPPQDEGMNSPKNLALEATYINHNFSQQVLKMGDERHHFNKPNPFGSDEQAEVASVGYRYRKWDLGKGIELVSRCEHDCVSQGPNKEVHFINVKALNEWDSKFCGGVDWRCKLDTQRGAVLATELKNNSCKLAKWTICANLAGSDLIKFGYVSRVQPKDSGKHVILGVQQFKPAEFLQQINLNMENCWGILRCIIDLCMKQEDGKYLLMKDPNKPIIRLYDIPNDSFESDDEGESSSDSSNVSSDEDDDDDDGAGEADEDADATKSLQDKLSITDAKAA